MTLVKLATVTVNDNGKETFVMGRMKIHYSTTTGTISYTTYFVFFFLIAVNRKGGSFRQVATLVFCLFPELLLML